MNAALAWVLLRLLALLAACALLSLSGCIDADRDFMHFGAGYALGALLATFLCVLFPRERRCP